MMMPCESIVKLFLPAIRAGVTKELYKKYNFNQVDIATKLGITQAAVSKYISGKYSKQIKTLEGNREISERIKKIASLVASKKSKESEGLIESTCYACKDYISEGWDCGVSPVSEAHKSH